MTQLPDGNASTRRRVYIVVIRAFNEPWGLKQCAKRTGREARDPMLSKVADRSALWLTPSRVSG